MGTGRVAPKPDVKSQNALSPLVMVPHKGLLKPILPDVLQNKLKKAPFKMPAVPRDCIVRKYSLSSGP